MERVLYVSDLDGTLLNDRAALSPFSRSTLQTLLAEGLPFTVASARSVVSIATMLDGLKLSLPVIEFNGAFLSDLATGRHEIVNSIEPGIVEAIYHLLPRFGCVPFISTFNGTEDCAYYAEIVNEGMRWQLNDRLAAGDRRWRRTDDLTRAFREQVVCLTIIGQQECLTELETAVLESHGDAVEAHLYENRYSRGWHWLTFHDRRATKDQAVRLLVERYGLAGSRLTVFGDHINDIKLFKVADCAVAVANAEEAVKRHATHVIGTNEEDSVVKYLLDDWARRQAPESFPDDACQNPRHHG